MFLLWIHKVQIFLSVVTFCKVRNCQACRAYQSTGVAVSLSTPVPDEKISGLVREVSHLRLTKHTKTKAFFCLHHAQEIYRLLRPYTPSNLICWCRCHLWCAVQWDPERSTWSPRQNTIAVNCARFISPIVARTVLDFGGRSSDCSSEFG